VKIRTLIKLKHHKGIQDVLRRTIPQDGVSGSSPDPDKDLWDIAAEEFPIKITKHELPEYVPGRIY